jgi:hypothetical protein
MNKQYIGVIAEDQSDVEVIEELIRKIVPNEGTVVRSMTAGGCGKLVGKCRQWASHLKSRECDVLVLLRDLDDKSKATLSKELEKALSPCPIPRYLIVIAVREIEAWLISDPQAIRTVFNLKADVPSVGNPESLEDPKKQLADLVYSRSAKTKRYLNTQHNKRLAAALRLECVRKCKSYLPFEKFIQDNFL